MLKLLFPQGKIQSLKNLRNFKVNYPFLSKSGGICQRKIEEYCVRTGKDKFGLEYYKIWFGIIP